MKTGGLVLIISSAFLLGLKCVDGKQRTARALGDYCSMLTLLSGELRSSEQPLPALLGEICPRARGRASMFLMVLMASMDRLGEQRFGSLWREALEQTAGELPSDARYELVKLGGVLGRYDTETQCREIGSCILLLRERELKLKNELPQYRRLVFGLVLTGAGMISLVLI